MNGWRIQSEYINVLPYYFNAMYTCMIIGAIYILWNTNMHNYQCIPTFQTIPFAHWSKNV